MRNKIIRLAIDCDGVLANFTKGALSAYKVITGRTIDPNSLKHWLFTSHLEFETAEQKELFHRALKAPGFAMSLEPLPGAKDAMKELRIIADVHVVTSPLSGSPTWAYERELWLSMHFGLPKSRIHHSEAKFVFSANIFVDDKPEHVREWSDYNPNGAAFLWDTPVNRQDTDLERLSSWEDLLDRLYGRLKP